MEYKITDFVKIEYDMYANGILVQTTNEKKGKEAKLKSNSYNFVKLILGKNFILKALDDSILSGKSENTLELTAENAFGKRKREFLRIMPKSAFDEQKLRPIVGMTYNFNGMFGNVKAITSSRITVDFNNPLSGKNIKIVYKVIGKIEKIEDKLKLVLEDILRISANMFEISLNDTEVQIKVPKQLSVMKEYLNKSFEELIPEVKNYKLTILPILEGNKLN